MTRLETVGEENRRSSGRGTCEKGTGRKA